MDTDLSLTTVELGSLKHASCVVVRSFFSEIVHPKVDEHTRDIPMFFHLACDAIAARIQMWLNSVAKLNNPSDFQPVLAGTRAMFEIAVDLTLFNLQEAKSLSKLSNWQRSAKLQYAKRLDKTQSPDRAWAAEFIKEQEEEIQALRDQTWPKSDRKKREHPPRWTGNNLGIDAGLADRLRPTGFVDYYNIQYGPTCWQVHGSGVLGLLELTDDMFPFISARALHDFSTFAIAASKLLLDLLDQYDDRMATQFVELEDVTLRAQNSVYESIVALRARPAPEGCTILSSSSPDVGHVRRSR